MKRWWAVAFAFFFCACLAAARITLAADAPDTDNGDTSATDNGDAEDPGDDTTAAMPPDAGAAAAPAVSEPSEGGGVAANGLITMNFQNVEIPVLARFISEITGKNFVVDENVRGRISIISPTRGTPAQAYSIFQSFLP